MWTQQNWNSLFDRISEYWPGSIMTRQGEASGLVKLWREELAPYPPASVLSALRKLKVEEDNSRAPSIRRVKAVAGEISMRDHGYEKNTPRARMLGRLGDLSCCHWTSPKGVRFMIGKEGLSVVDGDGAIPWGAVSTEDLATILRNNETEIDKGEEVTLDWARSVADELRRRGENAGTHEKLMRKFWGFHAVPKQRMNDRNEPMPMREVLDLEAEDARGVPEPEFEREDEVPF